MRNARVDASPETAFCLSSIVRHLVTSTFAKPSGERSTRDEATPREGSERGRRGSAHAGARSDAVCMSPPRAQSFQLLECVGASSLGVGSAAFVGPAMHLRG